MAKGQIKQKQATINQNTFESLCAIQCTQDEICAVLDVSIKTLNSWCMATYGESFSNIANKKREFGKSSLRRTQWKMAERNERMAVWLGKQYLGQKEPEQEVKHSGEINNTFINAINEASTKVWNEEQGE